MNDKEILAIIDSMGKTGAKGMLGVNNPNMPQVFEDFMKIPEVLTKIKDRSSGKKSYREFRPKNLNSMTIQELIKEILRPRYLQDKPEAAKSIDAILKQSDISEFLSKAVSDKTNVDVKEDSQEADRSTYGGGTVGVVDSPMTMEMLMRNQEPVPQDTTGLPRMDIETLFRLLSPQMQEPIPPR